MILLSRLLKSSQASRIGPDPHFASSNVGTVNASPKIYHCRNAAFVAAAEKRRENASKLRKHA
jgi:hypothetical protein